MENSACQNCGKSNIETEICQDCETNLRQIQEFENAKWDAYDIVSSLRMKLIQELVISFRTPNPNFKQEVSLLEGITILWNTCRHIMGIEGY